MPQADAGRSVYCDSDTVTLGLVQQAAVCAACGPLLLDLVPLLQARLRAVESLEACAIGCTTLSHIGAALPAHQQGPGRLQLIRTASFCCNAFKQAFSNREGEVGKKP